MPKLYVMCGISGSGKSTYQNLFRVQYEIVQLLYQLMNCAPRSTVTHLIKQTPN